MVDRRKNEVYLPGWLWFFLILPLALLVALLYRHRRFPQLAQRLRALPLPFKPAPRYTEPDSIPLDIRPEIPSAGMEELETGPANYAVMGSRGTAEIVLEQPAAASPSNRDDLTIIEGIGPKISSLLHEAGITNFAKLAEVPLEKLDEILTSARLRRLADPATWPEQARLAANEDWETLRQLQNTLKGGRKPQAG